MDKTTFHILEETTLPTQWGDFRLLAFGNEAVPHLALVHQSCDVKQRVTMRIHSECMTGDIFHSSRCDCGEQLHASMDKISEEKGMLVYLRQEGRGIGLIQKMKAYNLQDEGLDTAEANLKLGFPEDAREYDMVIDLVKYLDINKVKLLTNNPEKIKSLKEAQIDLVHESLVIAPSGKNTFYLETKKHKFGHLI